MPSALNILAYSIHADTHFTPQLCSADGGLQVREDSGTLLPLGFPVLRVKSNRLHCVERLWAPGGKPAPPWVPPANAVQLLCRALRLVPRSYHRFELLPDAGDPHELNGPLKVSGSVRFVHPDTGRKVARHDLDDAVFDSVTDLANATQHFAAAEHLTVQLSPDMGSIVVCRTCG